VNAINDPHETEVIPLALLQARLRRQDLLQEAKEREKRQPARPIVTFLWSRFRDAVVRMESRV